MHERLTIATVGDILDHAYHLHAHCRGCGRSTVVDLEELALRVGRDRVYVGGGLRLRCACGSRNVGITIEAPSTATHRHQAQPRLVAPPPHR